MKSLEQATAMWMRDTAAGALSFQRAAAHPNRVQAAILASHLRCNARSPWGERLGFGSIASIAEYQRRVPIVAWDDVADDAAAGNLTAEPVLMFEPTSGSSSAVKRIPYTATLRREFMRALGPWMHDLYSTRPQLQGGTAYWSISPASGREGFEDDRDYFDGVSRRALDTLLTVPSTVARINDIASSRYVTLRYLLADRNLTLFSVWHPTFLTLLVRQLAEWHHHLVEDIARGTVTPPAPLHPTLAAQLAQSLRPDPRRASELAAAGTSLQLIWPRLALISCWTEAAASLALAPLRALFPGVEIQPKGLLSTEGVVSIPFGERPGSVLAVRSHFLEFRQRDGGAVVLAGQLQEGSEYDVILTTGGGLTRYVTGDIIRVVGRFRRTPRVEFVGRDGDVSDLAGEKLSERFVRSVFQTCVGEADLVFLAPTLKEPPRYVLFVDSPLGSEELAALAARVDLSLSENPHYRFCRGAGQLGPVEAVRLRRGGIETYLRLRAQSGRIGDVKPRALERDVRWETRFRAEGAIA